MARQGVSGATCVLYIEQVNNGTGVCPREYVVGSLVSQTDLVNILH